MKEERGPWYLLTGLVIGIVFGLVYAWRVQPAEYFDTYPSSLRSEFKDQYRALIAAAYMANGDIVRARARLELLKDEDIFRVLSEQAQRTLAEGLSPDDARALGMLAIALGQEAPGPAVIITLPPSATASPTPSEPPTQTPTETSTPQPSETPTSSPTLPPVTPGTEAPEPSASPTASRTPRETSTPTKTQIPRPTFTSTLTRTPTATPGGPFVLLSREQVCTQILAAPLIQVEASNAFGDPLQGVLVIVRWNGGSSSFYTGLKPELGLGYADFTAVPGITYSVQLDEDGEIASDLSAVSCSGAGGTTFWGAWLLKFIQL